MATELTAMEAVNCGDSEDLVDSEGLLRSGEEFSHGSALQSHLAEALHVTNYGCSLGEFEHSGELVFDADDASCIVSGGRGSEGRKDLFDGKWRSSESSFDVVEGLLCREFGERFF